MTENKSSAVPQRREWDVEEFAHKAREKDREERERAHENEERLRKGLKPLRKKIELPKATQEMQARDKDLELSKNQGKTLMVDGVAGGRKGPGFHCETCSRSFKDSIAYLDHVNGRLHLRRLGQTTQVSRSTLEQVRDRLEYWQEEIRERMSRGGQGLEYDFEMRLAEIAKQQKAEKELRKKTRKEKKQPPEKTVDVDQETMAMMGFGSFGSTKRL